MNFDFSIDFSLTYSLLTVASFRIGVPSILFYFLKYETIVTYTCAFWTHIILDIAGVCADVPTKLPPKLTSTNCAGSDTFGPKRIWSPDI